ncbi:MAG: hypothetical protein ACF8CQ_14025 [Rhodopirellula sp. JB044]|uniref:hypothetical protein n=1 Tax=Rhodopirellula sp. JB044 TaxID=3342844 RepID=UPI00370A229C
MISTSLRSCFLFALLSIVVSAAVGCGGRSNTNVVSEKMSKEDWVAYDRAQQAMANAKSEEEYNRAKAEMEQLSKNQ